MRNSDGNTNCGKKQDPVNFHLNHRRFQREIYIMEKHTSYEFEEQLPLICNGKIVEN